MTKPKDYTIHCNEHGRQIGTIVCRHMIDAQNQVVGFVENSSEPNDLQAWCDACEAMYQQEGEITEAFEKYCDAGVVCSDCYQLFKLRHSHLK